VLQDTVPGSEVITWASVERATVRPWTVYRCQKPREVLPGASTGLTAISSSGASSSEPVKLRQPVSQPLTHRGSQCGVGDRHGTQPITRPEGQNFRLDQAEPFDSSRVGVMAKQRERTGFEPPAVEEQAVAAKRLRCCDQVGEDELPVGASNATENSSANQSSVTSPSSRPRTMLERSSSCTGADHGVQATAWPEASRSEAAAGCTFWGGPSIESFGRHKVSSAAGLYRIALNDDAHFVLTVRKLSSSR
jgi:hypothetical protein